MHERTNVNCLFHESSTHRRPWSSCHQDRSLLGLEIFNRPSAFATWGVWWSRGFLVLFYGSAHDTSKVNDLPPPVTSCASKVFQSDSESAWHLIESSPISEISSLGSNLWSSLGPEFYAVVCFLLRLFIDWLWFLMSCHMAVLYWLRPTWIPRGNCSVDETRRKPLQVTSVSCLSSSSSNSSVWIRTEET